MSSELKEIPAIIEKEKEKEKSKLKKPPLPERKREGAKMKYYTDSYDGPLDEILKLKKLNEDLRKYKFYEPQYAELKRQVEEQRNKLKKKEKVKKSAKKNE